MCPSWGKVLTASYTAFLFHEEGVYANEKNRKNNLKAKHANKKRRTKTKTPGHLDAVLSPEEPQSRFPLCSVQICPDPAIRREPKLKERVQLVENSQEVSQHEQNAHHSERGHPLDQTCSGRVDLGLGAR